MGGGDLNLDSSNKEEKTMSLSYKTFDVHFLNLSYEGEIFRHYRFYGMERINIKYI